MKAVASALRELIGLFVDDWPTSTTVIAWLAVVAFLLPFVVARSDVRAVALFAGLATVLVGSASLAARRPQD